MEVEQAVNTGSLQLPNSGPNCIAVSHNATSLTRRKILCATGVGIAGIIIVVAIVVPIILTQKKYTTTTAPTPTFVLNSTATATVFNTTSVITTPSTTITQNNTSTTNTTNTNTTATPTTVSPISTITMGLNDTTPDTTTPSTTISTNGTITVDSNDTTNDTTAPSTTVSMNSTIAEWSNDTTPDTTIPSTTISTNGTIAMASNKTTTDITTPSATMSPTGTIIVGSNNTTNDITTPSTTVSRNGTITLGSNNTTNDTTTPSTTISMNGTITVASNNTTNDTTTSSTTVSMNSTIIVGSNKTTTDTTTPSATVSPTSTITMGSNNTTNDTTTPSTTVSENRTIAVASNDTTTLSTKMSTKSTTLVLNSTITDTATSATAVITNSSTSSAANNDSTGRTAASTTVHSFFNSSMLSSSSISAADATTRPVVLTIATTEYVSTTRDGVTATETPTGTSGTTRTILETTTTATTTTTITFPPFLDVQSGTVYAVWNTMAGGNNILATSGSSGAGTYLTGQLPDNLFDNNLNTRYMSRGSSSSGINTLAGLNTGFFMTISQCRPVLTGFRFGNSFNTSTREPIRVTVEGTNCDNVSICTNWTLLYNNGSTGLDIQQNSLAYGEYQSITNSDIYQSYRFLITAKRSTSDFVSYTEVQLFGYANQTSSGANTGSNSTTLFAIQSGSTQPIWNTFAGGMSCLAVNSLTGVGTYYSGQSPDNLFDNKFTTRYTSRGNSSSGINLIAGLNTGFHVTIARCQPTLTMFRFATASNGSSTSRDPMIVTVEGTDCNSLFNCTSWTLLYNGTTGLDAVTNRSSYGSFKTIPSPQAFTSYRFLITEKRSTSDFVTYSEVELYGY